MGTGKKGFFRYFLIIFPVLCLMAVWLGFGDRGFVNLYRMEKERQRFLGRIQRLEMENQKLLAEIDRLKSDRAYVEAVARRELGLIKENEILYRFNDRRKAEP